MHRRDLTFAVALAVLGACGAGEVPAPEGTPSRSVTQGGPQDIGQFRKIVAGRGVPSSELLDEVGFFNEHALDLPPAGCGESLCFHPMLAVAPRFDDGNWTMAFVAMNTAADPASLPVPPRHFLLVVESSPAVSQTLDFSRVTAALRPWLRQDDLFSIVFADDRPRVIAFARPGREIESHRIGQAPGDGTRLPFADLYGALALAHEVALAPALAGRQHQMLLLTSGQPGGGVQVASAFQGLARKFADAGVVISSFGMGLGYRREIPRLLSEATGGNYYYAESAGDLADAVSVAGQTGFVPLARNLRLRVTAAPGYRIGEVYGAARVQRSATEVVLEVPTAYIGARTGAQDVTSGRRGGGGGFFVELVAEAPPGRMPAQEAPAYSLAVSYVEAASGQPRAHRFVLASPLGVGNNPPPNAPFFSDPARAKPFMMLNMYLALHTAVALYEARACGAALGVEEMMRRSYELWRELYEDPDIDADFALLEALTAAIRTTCRAPVVQPVEVPMSCFWF